jgi:hypothetical protein
LDGVEALFTEEGEVAEVPPVLEDVFMADYTKFKDEDDDGSAAGALLSGDSQGQEGFEVL